MSNRALERQAEWRFVRIAGLLLAAVVAVDLVAWGVLELTRPAPPTRLQRTITCFTSEKGLSPDPDPADPIAQSASAGALSLAVEGNPITIALVADPAEARRIARAYRSVAGTLENRLFIHGLTVWLFQGEATSVQVQTLLDCHY